ncbi:MAG: FG-GAP repeat domain-containing protein [Kofleriaceae bacterium]
MICGVACTSFEPVDRGVCGNGLVEAGEDCDADDPSCVRCAVVCTEDADCPSSAYACGADGTCHAPSGALAAPVAAGAFLVEDILVTDIDRDGIGDAVGVSSTSIAIRYGDPAARLSRSESVLTPSHSGPPAIGDLDGDGATDLALLASDGLVAYGSRFGELAPMSARSALVDTAGGGGIDMRKVFTLSRFSIGALAADSDQGGAVGIFALDFLGNFVGAAPCFGRLGTLSAAQVPAENIDVYKVSESDSVVAFVTSGASPKLCVMALHKPLFGDWQITDITPANAAGLARKPILADLETDADRCPGLVNTDAGSTGLRYWDGAMSGGTCTLTQVPSPIGTALPPIPGNAMNLAVGRIPLSPMVMTFAADMLVMNDGVYAYVPGAGGGFGQLYSSERRLGGADFADLDGDAEVDGVLIAESEDDVDVLFRRANFLFPSVPGYVVYRVDTSSRVVATKIGDYDGNGRLDLAIVEQLADYQRMLVSYGTADYLSPTVSVAAFESVIALATVPFAGAEDQAGITDDLIVLQPPPPGQTSNSITLLLGSTLGTMIPFFDPRSDDDPDMDGPMLADDERLALTNVVIGRFGGAASDGPGDLLAIGVDSTETPQSGPVLWRMPGTDVGPDSTEVPAKTTSGLADCQRSVGTGLCVREARYLAWPVSDDADVVFAIDRATPPHAVRFDPAASGAAMATVLAPVVDGLGTSTVVQSLQHGDLDGDGARELIVVARPRTTSGQGVVLVCTTSGASVTECSDVVPRIAEAASALGTPIDVCVGAAPIRATYHDRDTAPSSAQSLVVACRDGDGSALYRVHGDEVGILARTSSRLDRIHVGDVTGDRVDDVLAIEGESGAQTLVVFRHCSSREQASCAGGRP